MSSIISVTCLEKITRNTLMRIVSHPKEVEITAFISSMITSFGMAAVDLARSEKSPVRVFNSVSTGRTFLNFRELSRSNLLNNLASGSGFETRECEAVLIELEMEVRKATGNNGSVFLERIGALQRISGGGWRLELAEELCVIPAKA